RRRHTRLVSDWSSDVCSSDLLHAAPHQVERELRPGDVGDDEVEEALSRLQASRLPGDCGRGEVGELREERGTHRLLRCLQVSHRSEEHTSELQSLTNLVCRLL